MVVKFINPTYELIRAIADDMRQADIDEVWASHHHTPLESLMNGQKISSHSLIITVDDEPCVMIGLVKRDILSGTGTPWLLGTDKSLKHKRHYIDLVPAIINDMLNVCPNLVNYVHVKNKVSLRWLKWIGFTIDEPHPYGVEGELFHRFHLEREN